MGFTGIFWVYYLLLLFWNMLALSSVIHEEKVKRINQSFSKFPISLRSKVLHLGTPMTAISIKWWLEGIDIDLPEGSAQIYSGCLSLILFSWKCAVHILYSFIKSWAYIWIHLNYFWVILARVPIKETIEPKIINNYILFAVAMKI